MVDLRTEKEFIKPRNALKRIDDAQYALVLYYPRFSAGGCGCGIDAENKVLHLLIENCNQALFSILKCFVEVY